MITISKDKSYFHLSCDSFSYVLAVKEGQLLNLYFGRPLPEEADLSYLLPSFYSNSSFEQPLQHLPLELPSVGTGWYGNPALQAMGPDGNNITKLTFAEAKILPHKEPLEGLPSTQDPSAETLQLFLKDDYTGLAAVLSYTIVDGALARSMKLTNGGSSPLTLSHMASAALPLPGMDYEVIHLRGAWARERRLVRTPIGQAAYRVESQRGASGHEENPFIALVRPEATEHTGDVYGLSLIYSGSFLAEAQVSDFDSVHLSIGLNPMTHRWLLGPGESFQTPEAALVYSPDGLNGMSQIYHRLYRDHLCRSPWAKRERPILINNWEATYFDINEEKILALGRRASEIGIELLVMDDGWFGNRKDDHRALGDWYENPVKLPHGLNGLSRQVNELGLKFGLWFEPEMISPDSDLYRAHPDWCLHAPGRSRTLGRHQLILDLSREDVQTFLIRTMKKILSSANIAYVKWDMNRNMTESFSALLPPERQLETQHRYMLGLYRVLEEVTGAFPEILFESCSGGGGRFDPGMLYYMPQTWTSDDTDAVERLKIQYGTSIVYPASAMGAHVSASPNHQVGRRTSIRMRADVAIGGNFGFELDLAQLSPEDLSTAKAYVERLKKLRSLTARGTFTRLLSPFDDDPSTQGNYTAWQFADDHQVLLCYYRVLAEANPIAHRVFLKGLDPTAIYQLDDAEPLPRGLSSRSFSGAALMQAGLPMTFTEGGDFVSRTLLFTKQA